MGELDNKESWALTNRCFWTVVLEKIFESPLDYKNINPTKMMISFKNTKTKIKLEQEMLSYKPHVIQISIAI